MELAGIMGAIGTFSGQPSGTAVFGDITYAVDIASYQSAILAAIPEPAEAGLWCAGLIAIATLLRWRFRGRR